MKNITGKIVQLVTKKTNKKTVKNHLPRNNDNVAYLDPGVAFFMNTGKELGLDVSLDQVTVRKVEDLVKMPYQPDNPLLNSRIMFHKNKIKGK